MGIAVLLLITSGVSLEIDLTPLPKFIEITGGEQKFESITAGDYLHQRLVEIGLADS